MRVSFSLGKRIASGIVLVLVLMLAVGLAGYFGLTGVLRVVELSDKVNDLIELVSSTEAYTDKYLVSTFSGDKALEDASIAGINGNISEAMKKIAEVKAHPSVTAENAGKLETMKSDAEKYSLVFKQFKGAEDERRKIEQTVLEDFPIVFDIITKALFRAAEMNLQGNLLKNPLLDYFKRPSADNWGKFEKARENFDVKFKEYYEFIGNSDAMKEQAAELGKRVESIRTGAQRYHDLSIAQQGFKKTMEGHARNLESLCKQFDKMADDGMQAQSRLSIRLIFGFIGLALLLGTVYSVLSVRGIVRRLTSVIDGVTEGSRQVAADAAQVSSAGQVLAEGSSEQASSLEEASSALEEMSSLTKHNAERANEAKNLMADVNVIVEKVSTHMNSMADAVQEITRSSEETSKIVRTIDEIAFQTNLLALNAAVEAARAGESGAGFAIVAEEVRNLAKRAAEASRNSAQLIEGTIRNISAGNKLTTATKEAFGENMAITSKVGQLVDEISGASQEQSLGIEQVNRAVSQMSTITQSSAASAEESAAAAAQMTSQAEQMQDLVENLRALVGGNGNGRAEREPSPDGKSEKKPRNFKGFGRHALPAPDEDDEDSFRNF